MTKLEPKFELSWERRSNNVQSMALILDLALTSSGMESTDYLDVRNFGESLIITVGHPIFGDKIDIDKSIKLVMEGCSPSGINGQFLFVIFDRHSEKLRIINDRFTSYPVYLPNSAILFC